MRFELYQWLVLKSNKSDIVQINVFRRYEINTLEPRL